MNIEVQNRQRRHRIERNMITDKSKAILSLCGCEDTELSILIVNNRRMRELNKLYRGIDSPTDVLAFPMLDTGERGGGKGEGEPRLLGDIVISMEKVYSQAREQGHSAKRELVILLIHGILHLIGYDHERSPQDERRMKKKEGYILARI